MATSNSTEHSTQMQLIYYKDFYRIVVYVLSIHLMGTIQYLLKFKLMYLSRLIVEEKLSLQYCLDDSGFSCQWQCGIQLVRVPVHKSYHRLKMTC